MQLVNFNSSSLIERFKIHLSENFQGLESKKLLLALSGGIDSVVLLDLLSSLGADLSLAHGNFKLRGQDSDRDEDFVRELSDRYKASIHIKHFDTTKFAFENKCSIQMAARELRYDWFDYLMKVHGYDHLITAHHADDNLETFFINLSRGTGIDGLCGIPENTGKIIRPLLPFTREEIHTYALNQKLRWREDQSNKDEKYLRNKIRLRLAPVLRELNPGFMNSFQTTLHNLKGSRDIVKEHLKQVMREVIVDNSEIEGAIMGYKVEALKKYAVNSAYLYQLFQNYGFHQFEDIRSLLHAQSGKQVHSKTHRLLKSRDLLILSKNPVPGNEHNIREIAQNDRQVTIGNNELHFETLASATPAIPEMTDRGNSTAHFDKDLLRFPLCVRKWQKGDYFYPLGLQGKKKLSKYFKDEKFSGLEKENIWLLCSGKDIIWVIGKRMDDRYKLSNKTRTILKATLYK